MTSYTMFEYEEMNEMELWDLMDVYWSMKG